MVRETRLIISAQRVVAGASSPISEPPYLNGPSGHGGLFYFRQSSLARNAAPQFIRRRDLWRRDALSDLFREGISKGFRTL
jgi:hypothetical protein